MSIGVFASLQTHRKALSPEQLCPGPEPVSGPVVQVLRDHWQPTLDQPGQRPLHPGTSETPHNARAQTSGPVCCHCDQGAPLRPLNPCPSLLPPEYRTVGWERCWIPPHVSAIFQGSVSGSLPLLSDLRVSCGPFSPFPQPAPPAPPAMGFASDTLCSEGISPPIWLQNLLLLRLAEESRSPGAFQLLSSSS